MSSSKAESLAYECYGIKIGDKVTCVDGFLFGEDPNPLGGGYGYKPGRTITISGMSLYREKNQDYPDKGQIILWGSEEGKSENHGIFAIATNCAKKNSLGHLSMLIREELT